MTFRNNIATKSTFFATKNPRRLSILDFFVQYISLLIPLLFIVKRAVWNLGIWSEFKCKHITAIFNRDIRIVAL